MTMPRNAFPAMLAIVAVVASHPTVAQDMAKMPGMSAPPASEAVRTGQGTGVVKGIDPGARMLTLKHGPIPTLGWPAMTTNFKVDPAASMTDLKVGQPVAFDVKAKRMRGEITGLRPQS